MQQAVKPGPCQAFTRKFSGLRILCLLHLSRLISVEAVTLMCCQMKL